MYWSKARLKPRNEEKIIVAMSRAEYLSIKKKTNKSK